VLLVEDNAADVLLVEEAMQEAGVNVELAVLADGEAALDVLTRHDGRGDVPLPQVVLLDLNLPRLSGWDVMTAVRADDDARHIPILVLSTSDSDADIYRAYREGANCYMVKPMDFGDFVDAMRATADFWFAVAALPSPDARRGGAA
jgi:two-component system response regulator